MVVRRAVHSDARAVLAVVCPADPDAWLERWPALMASGSLLVSCGSADQPPQAVALVRHWTGLDGQHGAVEVLPRGNAKAGAKTHRGELLRKAREILRATGLRRFEQDGEGFQLQGAHNLSHGPAR